MAKKVDNKFIPKYVPNDLPWHQRDGHMTWYDQNKCNDFLEDTNEQTLILTWLEMKFPKIN